MHEERFSSNIKKRGLVRDRGMDVTRTNMREIREEVERRGWQELVSPRLESCKTLVREFYANAYLEEKNEEPSYTSNVRGKHISYSPATIFSLYKLPELETNEFNDLRASKWEPQELLETLCYPGAIWTMTSSRKRPSFLTIFDLLPVARAWCQFVQGLILPVSHYTEVYTLRALLTFCLVKKKSVDVGDIIAHNIYMTAQSGSQSLVNHTVIMDLICEAGVTDPVSDPIRPWPPTSSRTIQDWIDATKQYEVYEEAPTTKQSSQAASIPSSELQVMSYAAQQHTIQLMQSIY